MKRSAVIAMALAAIVTTACSSSSSEVAHQDRVACEAGDGSWMEAEHGDYRAGHCHE